MSDETLAGYIKWDDSLFGEVDVSACVKCGCWLDCDLGDCANCEHEAPALETAG